ncbi:hypothetical protein N7475_005361 [Penicillium sp. IBT 31633x]|nr:hypothetical protein N7475_005361 [Penicillium sp. IBT 31633x]
MAMIISPMSSMERTLCWTTTADRFLMLNMSTIISIDGFSRNGIIAKLEVIVRDKIVCMRDGGTSDDEYYLIFVFYLCQTDTYRPPTGHE